MRCSGTSRSTCCRSMPGRLCGTPRSCQAATGLAARSTVSMRRSLRSAGSTGPRWPRVTAPTSDTRGYMSSTRGRASPESRETRRDDLLAGACSASGSRVSSRDTTAPRVRHRFAAEVSGAADGGSSIAVQTCVAARSRATHVEVRGRTDTLSAPPAKPLDPLTNCGADRNQFLCPAGAREIGQRSAADRARRGSRARRAPAWRRHSRRVANLEPQ